MKLYPIKSLLLIGILILAVTVACGRSVPSSNGVASGDSSTVNVVAQEFKFTLDVSQASPGTVTFTIRNEGQMPHDFAINGNGVEAKTPHIEPGETATLEVTLEPGSYNYECTVPGHAMLGMKGVFTVES